MLRLLKISLGILLLLAPGTLRLEAADSSVNSVEIRIGAERVKVLEGENPCLDYRHGGKGLPVLGSL